MSDLAKKIEEYYIRRELVTPNVWEALGWANTELGEVYEVLQSWNDKWIRNNPHKHPVKSKEDLAEELGDVIMMLMVAGMVEGVDPLDAMMKKMQTKLDKLAVINAEVKLLSEEEAKKEFEPECLLK